MSDTSNSQTFAKYLTVTEAAGFLGVSPWTLRNWDKAGKLRPIRHPLNGYRIYRQEDLEALLRTDDLLGKRKDTFTPHFDWSEIGRSEHFVQFYETDAYLVESVSSFIGNGLAAGEGAVVIATQSHRHRVHKKLRARGLDVSVARQCGQYVVLDAAETLSRFMAGGAPDPGRFQEVVGGVIERLAIGRPRVRAFGEMVALLWAEGNRDAACRLEQLWNDLARTHSFALFCAYPLRGFGQEADRARFDEICACHARVLPAESYARLPAAREQLRAIVSLQQKAQVLEAEVARRREAEWELADFVENAPMALHKVGPDGMILWANQAELDLLGYQPEEYVGHHVTAFHADQAAIAEILGKLRRGEDVHSYPARLRCKDGSVKEVLIDSNACFRDGNFAYSRCFTRDATEIREAEKDRALLAAIVESSDDAIVSKTLDGTIRSWNGGAEWLFGYTAREAVGRPITLIIPPERHEEERQILDRLRRGERIDHFETVRVSKDGRRMDISLTISPIRDGVGNIVGASKVARDITDRKRAEQALREADRRKDEFLATLAHELRNPLAPIRNSLHILRMGDGPDRAERELLEVMERQVQHLSRLVDDLLEVSRISRGKISLKKDRLDLAAVLGQAVETSKPLIEAAGHRITVSLPPEPITLNGDLVRLAQIFANLLNNAARYTENGGCITVRARREGSQAVVSIRDTGIGIPRDMLSCVFEMFAQVENPLRRSREGLGIGLSLVRTLVSMHGGTVEAHSEGVGHGSEFVVRLPAAEPDQPAPGTARCPGVRAAPAIPSHRILAVDDNRDAADSLGHLLRLLGAVVHVAYDGSSALEAMRTHRPSVVLLDIGMPGMDGHEVARRVRQDPELRDLTLIALTGWGQKEDRLRSLEAGFDHHLVKPVDLKALRDLLTSLNGKAR